jgi:hypothetical protein
MTIAEVKGLEFNDVLLFNFFSDSISNWDYVRQFTNELKKKHKVQSTPERHSGLLETSFEQLEFVRETDIKNSSGLETDMVMFR